MEKKDDKKLYPLEIAFLVNDYLQEHFTSLMNYEFTASMEDKLDEVSVGGQSWQAMMHEFYTPFESEIGEAKK